VSVLPSGLGVKVLTYEPGIGAPLLVFAFFPDKKSGLLVDSSPNGRLHDVTIDAMTNIEQIVFNKFFIIFVCLFIRYISCQFLCHKKKPFFN
jgi:hypothetical protein